MTMRIAAVCLTLMLLVQSSYLIVLSTREGPGEMTLLALAVALAPVAVLWGVFFALRHRPSGTRLFVICGAVLAGTMEVVLPVSPFKTTWQTGWQRRALSAVEVVSVRDEPYLSRRGNPVGVRVTFEASFPRGGRLDVSPTLYPSEERYRHYQTSMGHLAGFGMTPPAVRDDRGYRFERGSTHMFTVDFLPVFLVEAQRAGRVLEEGELCLWMAGTGSLSSEELEDLLRAPLETRYQVEVNVKGNTYFLPARTVYRALSEHRYSLKTFYGSALAEGAQPCPW